MNKLLCFATLLLLSISAHAKANLDSLWSVWNDPSQADTSRLAAMSTFSFDGYVSSQPDSAFYFSQLQYDLAKNTGHEGWMANALSTQGVSFIKRSDYEQATEYLNRSLQLSEEIGNMQRRAEALVNLGVISWRTGNFEQALANFSQSLSFFEESGDQAKIANLLYNIGVIAYQQSNLLRALEVLSRCEKLCKEVGDQKMLSRVMNVKGLIYLGQEDLDQALEYFSQYLKIRQEMGEKESSLAGGLSNIGVVYEKKGDLSKAMEYYTRSLKLFEERGAKRHIAGVLSQLGGIAFKQEQYEQALAYHTQSFQIREEIGDKSGIANSLLAIGKEEVRQGKQRQAQIHFKRSLRLAQEMGDIESTKAAAEHLALIYKETGQYQQALGIYELYIEMRDSIQNNENTKIILRNELQADYDKQKALDDLENEKQLELEQEKQEKQQLLSIAIGVGLLLSLVLAGVIFNRLNVTNRQKVEIEQQKQRAERSEKHKEQFLANMSHEIRTPMHAISGMVKILERNEHAAEQDVYLDAMHQSSDNLLVILNDILDLSKIEAGKLDVEIMPIQPTAVIENVSKILTFKAAEKGLHLHINIAPDVPKFVMGDPTRLNQILTNLAGNAIKFTSTGSVSISVKRKNEFLIYEVRDSGIGIPEDKLQNIFEAFEQGSSSITQTYGGTGLGLNISQQLVELQGGNIWAESVAGTGSTFFVSLPLIPVKDEAIHKISLTEEQVQSMATALKGTRILLAEDNAFNQMIVQDDLQFYVQDIDIQVVENGATAFEAFQTGDYDLILMDVQMPEMDGYQATINIREWEQANSLPRIPIIAMTASLLKSEVNLCFEVGMDNYIPKPYTIEELIGRIYGEVKKAQAS